MLPTGATCIHRWDQPLKITKFIAFTTILSTLFIIEGASFSLGAVDLDEVPGKTADKPAADIVRQSAEVQGGENGRIIVPASYSIHDRPPSQNNETATKVSCYVDIMKVMDVNEVHEEISLELTLGCLWIDARLKHFGRNRSELQFLLVNQIVLNEIWLPDLFYDGVNKISQPALLVKPMALKINSKGEVMHEGRWTVTLACQMHFEHYPADTQRCFIDLRSYAHNDEHLQLVWSDISAVTMQESFKLPNFDVTLDSKHDLTAKGRGNKIRFTISLRRKMSYHVIQTYLPSSLFVFISWLSFLIPSGSTPERLGCSMTTLLTLTAMFAAVRYDAPNVSYVKALDIWMLACIILVCLTLLVHILIIKFRSMRSEKLGRPVQMAARSVNRNTACAADPETAVGETQVRPWKRDSGAKVGPETELLEPCETYAFRLESWAPFIIPALFLIFNLLYWPVLMSKSGYNRKLYSMHETGWLDDLVAQILPDQEAKR